MRFMLWAVVACGFVVGDRELNTWMGEEEDGYFLDSMDSDTWPDHLSTTDKEGDSVENPQIDDTTPGTSGNNFVVAPHLNDQQLSGAENNTTNSNLTLGFDNNTASNNLSLSEKLPGSANNTASNNLTMGDRIKKLMGFGNSTNAKEKQEPSTEQTVPQGQQASGPNNMTSEPRVQSQNITSSSPAQLTKLRRREGLKDLKVPKEYVKPYEPKGLKNRNTSQNTDIPGKPEIPGDSKASGNKSLELPRISETLNIKEENTSSSEPPSGPEAPGNKAQNTTLPVAKLQKAVNNNLPEESKILQKKIHRVPEGGAVDATSQVSTMNITELKNATGTGSMIINNITVFENITIPRNVTVFKGINIEDKNGTPEVKKSPYPKHEVHPVNVSHSKHKIPVPASNSKPEVPVPVSHPKSEVAVPVSYPEPKIPVPVPYSKHKVPVPAAHSKPEEPVLGSHPKPEVPFVASHPGANTSVPASHPLPEVPIAEKTSPAHGWMPPSPPPVVAHKGKKNITSYPHAAHFTTRGNTSSGVTSVTEGTDTVIVPHNLTVIVNTKP